ncbi:MAG: putative peptidoglycan glycosyltransferase FtsW [Candidatus Nealsonbacteria bacterium]|nr:putative peptidoglycan glycosyltransferase FtsW [Candidatus Nealsonbacteria bacterium]
MVKDKHLDYFLLAIITILMLFGIVVLASVSSAYSFRKFDNTYYYLKHQILFGLLPGLFFGFLAFKTKLSFLKKSSPLLLLGTLILMVMVFLPGIGMKSGDSARWINLRIFTFQPSELLKLVSIIYFATWLESRVKKEEKPLKRKIFSFDRTFISFSMIIGIIALLLFFQSNISTLGVIAITAFLMYFSMDTPVFHSVAIILLGSGALMVLIKLAAYRVRRLAVFLNPDLDPMGMGYQLKQALFAIGSGGITGVGLGMSAQKSGFLPQTISDSIFAVFAEEAGFVGAIFLIVLFLLFAFLGFRVAKRSQDDFSRLAALGITFWIIIQAFVNIGAMIGLLPLTGIPLPFIGYGGSALALELIGMGILLNISKNSQT